MNRRSFCHRVFGAIVAAQMARELTASAPEIAEPEIQAAVETWLNPTQCERCTYWRKELMGEYGYPVAYVIGLETQCDDCLSKDIALLV